jgi:hypothetical protein
MVDQSIKNYLAIIVPPVAKAVQNLKNTKIQNQGEIEAATPQKSCIMTATTNGMRRPNLARKI